jgi:uncharacterized phage-associated protein
MNYMRLLKLLYIAEREILQESGQSLTGCETIAMKRGPVLEEVYSLIRGQHHFAPQWGKFFQTERYDIVMTADPGNGRLSRFITSKLQDVADRHVNDDEWQLVEVTHQFPEWKNNDPGVSSKPIPLIDILRAIGREDDYEQIVANNQMCRDASEFFSDDACVANELPPKMSF